MYGEVLKPFPPPVVAPEELGERTGWFGANVMTCLGEKGITGKSPEDVQRKIYSDLAEHTSYHNRHPEKPPCQPGVSDIYEVWSIRGQKTVAWVLPEA